MSGLTDIDSERMLIRVERGKGGRYRNAMLPGDLLILLWRAHAHHRDLRTVDAPARLAAIRQADRDGCGVTRHALLLLDAAALALRPSVELAPAAPMDAARPLRRLDPGQVQPHPDRSAPLESPSWRSSGRRLEPSSQRQTHETP